MTFLVATADEKKLWVRDEKGQHASAVGALYASDAKPLWKPQRQKGKGQKQLI